MLKKFNLSLKLDNKRVLQYLVYQLQSVIKSYIKSHSFMPALILEDLKRFNL